MHERNLQVSKNIYKITKIIRRNKVMTKNNGTKKVQPLVLNISKVSFSTFKSSVVSFLPNDPEDCKRNNSVPSVIEFDTFQGK